MWFSSYLKYLYLVLATTNLVTILAYPIWQSPTYATFTTNLLTSISIHVTIPFDFWKYITIHPRFSTLFYRGPKTNSRTARDDFSNF